MDDLQQLLAKADATAPPARPGVAELVRQLSRRRRRRRHLRIAGLCIVLAVVSSVAIVELMPREPSVSTRISVRRDDVATLRQEIAELNSQVRFHEQIAQAIENSRMYDEQAGASGLEFSEPDMLMQLDQRRQVAAQLMLAHAEQLASDPQKHEEAAANYRNIVALFPDTLASRAANDRLRAAGI